MAGDLRAEGSSRPQLDGSGLRIAIVAARFNDAITHRLLAGVRRGLEQCLVAPDAVVEAWVPGAFEIPLAAKTFAATGRLDAVVCVGAVIRGATGHYEIVAGESARGVQEAQLATGVPVIFGVLTTENAEQAFARSEDAGGHNVGEECAHTAVEMALLVRTIKG